MEIDVHRPTDDELQVFIQRIAKRLAERPVDLDPDLHRERIAGLLRQAGDASFYQLLDLPPTAAAREIHEAYEQVARLVHPANAARLELVGREGVLEVLFERLTAAYLNLSHPERRKAYDRGLSADTWSAVARPAPARRQEETRETAEHYHKRALELIASDDYYLAIELLREAVRIAPRAELYALLGKLQAKNPRWLRASAESLQQALALGAKEPDLSAALHEVQRRLAAGEGRSADLTTGITSRTAHAGKREIPEVEGARSGGRDRQAAAVEAAAADGRGQTPATIASRRRSPGCRFAGLRAARGGKSELQRAACSLTARRGDATESATENRPPGSFGGPVRVKRCGKSAPLRRRRRRHGKPHAEQDQIGRRYAGCPSRPHDGSSGVGPASG